MGQVRGTDDRDRATTERQPLRGVDVESAPPDQASPHPNDQAREASRTDRLVSGCLIFVLDTAIKVGLILFFYLLLSFIRINVLRV